MKRELKYIGLSVICGLLFTFFVSAAGYAKQVHQVLEEKFVRFHVLANSDSAGDQTLKLKVRDAVLDYLEPELRASASKQETMKIIGDNIAGITAAARKAVADNGYNYGVSVSLARDYFPTKTYGGVTLPAGVYDACRIVIGKGAGHNWWCVMFPPLCYVDVTKGQVPEADKGRLKALLPEEDYSLITGKSKGIEFKFKVVEIFEELFDSK